MVSFVSKFLLVLGIQSAPDAHQLVDRNYDDRQLFFPFQRIAPAHPQTRIYANASWAIRAFLNTESHLVNLVVAGVVTTASIYLRAEGEETCPYGGDDLNKDRKCYNLMLSPHVQLGTYRERLRI
jgi:hypothetical protein